jgi:nicotinamide mononucleotide transporter
VEAVTLPEAIAVALALAYLLLAIRQNPWCWAAAVGSSALYGFVMWEARLYLMAGLQVFFIAMAAYGWRQWRGSRAAGDPLPVTRLPAARHGILLAAIAVLTVLSATLLATTVAALPWLDAAITWGSVAATWLTARKVLENWHYWFVIDVASVGVYLERGLYATAALFVVYVVLVIVGYRSWLRTVPA